MTVFIWEYGVTAVINKEAVLVAHGITREGKRVVLQLTLGDGESTESWNGVLNDLGERGLRQPQLLITDGNQGLLKAMRNIWPKIVRQRCAIYRIRNVLARVTKKRQDEVRKALYVSFALSFLTMPDMKLNSFCAATAERFPPLVRP